MNDHPHFDFEQMPDSDDYTAFPVRPDTPERHHIALPFSPLFAGFIAATALAAAALLFLAALPGESKTLVYQGEEVQSTDWCGTKHMCVEIADTVVTETGWGVVQLVFAAVLAAGAAYLVYDTMKVKRRRKRTRPVVKKRTKYY
jgi:hypothetical protein